MILPYTDISIPILESWILFGGKNIDVAFDIVPWAEYGERFFSNTSQPVPSYGIVMVAGHLWMAQFVNRGWSAPLALKMAASEVFLDWLPYLRVFGEEFIADTGEPLLRTTSF